MWCVGILLWRQKPRASSQFGAAVVVKGLPFSSMEPEIANFFDGCTVQRVHILRRPGVFRVCVCVCVCVCFMSACRCLCHVVVWKKKKNLLGVFS